MRIRREYKGDTIFSSSTCLAIYLLVESLINVFMLFTLVTAMNSGVSSHYE